MKSHKANVIVHLSGRLDSHRHHQIRQAVAARHGVGGAASSYRTERLILVDYDPAAISATSILETVRGEGVEASLIGL